MMKYTPTSLRHAASRLEKEAEARGDQREARAARALQRLPEDSLVRLSRILEDVWED